MDKKSSQSQCAFNNAYNNFSESVNKEEFTNFATSLNTNSAIEGFKQ